MFSPQKWWKQSSLSTSKTAFLTVTKSSLNSRQFTNATNVNKSFMRILIRSELHTNWVATMITSFHWIPILSQQKSSTSNLALKSFKLSIISLKFSTVCKTFKKSIFKCQNSRKKQQKSNNWKMLDTFWWQNYFRSASCIWQQRTRMHGTIRMMLTVLL